MTYEDYRREELITDAVSMILDNVPIPVDLLSELDNYGVNINWLFTEAASIMSDGDSYLCMGAIK